MRLSSGRKVPVKPSRVQQPDRARPKERERENARIGEPVAAAAVSIVSGCRRANTGRRTVPWTIMVRAGGIPRRLGVVVVLVIVSCLLVQETRQAVSNEHVNCHFTRTAPAGRQGTSEFVRYLRGRREGRSKGHKLPQAPAHGWEGSPQYMKLKKHISRLTGWFNGLPFLHLYSNRFENLQNSTCLTYGKTNVSIYFVSFFTFIFH